MEKMLQELGLTQHEIAIYIACLKGNLNTPSSLARSTGIKRSTVYFHIQRLVAKGLLAFQVKKRRKYIVATPLQVSLQSLVENQKDKVFEYERLIKKLLPQLENIHKNQNNQSRVQYYEGAESGRMIIQKIVAAKTDIHWIGSIETILKNIKDDTLYRKLTLERMKQNTTAYAITDKKILSEPRFSEKIGNFRQMRFLEEEFGIPGILCAFGDTVVFFSAASENIKTFIIEDKIIANIIILLFWALWAQAKERANE